MTFTGIIALLYSNKYLRQLRKLIESGRGTFSDTFRYTDKSADLLGDLFYGSVLDMPDEERITSCVELLRDRHKDINGLFDIAQRSLDKKAGLSIAPQHVPFDEERAKQIGTSLTDKTVPETTIQRRAKSATANATRSMHDDCIEANAKFRAKAGLQCYITRTTDGSCCKWCTQMAGRYEYGSEPKSVYRRHDNCGCMVTYENGRKRQNVWSKKTWEVPADDAGAPPPVVFTQEQAAAAGAPPPKSFTKEEARTINLDKTAVNKQIIASKSEKMASVGANLIQAEPVQHSVEEKLELAQFARSLGIEYQNAMSFDGDIDLMKEQLNVMASLRDEFNLPRRIVLYVKDLGDDLGETFYRKTIMINSSAMRSKVATSTYLNSDRKLSSTQAIGIGVHEVGHLIAQKYGEIGLDIAQKTCYNISGIKHNYFQTLNYLLDNISEYSVIKNPNAKSNKFKPTHYHEIIPEVLGKHFTAPDNFTTEFYRILKEVCQL